MNLEAGAYKSSVVRKAETGQVLIISEIPDPHPALGEVRIRVAASGISPARSRSISVILIAMAPHK
jgi:NADPH:quinone reductase-like Zn-dependent oxidoreductase